jgi:hypothetical protein
LAALFYWGVKFVEYDTDRAALHLRMCSNASSVEIITDGESREKVGSENSHGGHEMSGDSKRSGDDMV